VHALQENKVLKNLRITSIAAAALLASPAFAGPPFARAAQLDEVDGQRVITEVVVDGRLIEGADEAPANELRPVSSWLDQGGARDRRHQHSW
jgi:hypothetical protein